MAEQILRARDTDTSTISDIGEENNEGNIGVRVVDVDVRAFSKEIRDLIDDGGAETVLEVLKAIETAVETDVSGGLTEVTNFPADYPDSAAQSSLVSVLAALENGPDTAISVLNTISSILSSSSVTVNTTSPLHVTGSVGVDFTEVTNKLDEVITTLLDSPDSAISVLKQIRDQSTEVTVSGAVHVTGDVGVTNFPADYPDSVAQSTLSSIASALEEGADSTISVLKAIRDQYSTSVSVANTVGVTGDVGVNNFPADYPDAVAQGHLSNRYGGGKTTEGGTITTDGDNTIVSVPGGSFIRLYWVFVMTDPDESSFPLIQVKTGASVKYATYNAIGHWEIIDGGNGEDLVINVATAADIAWCATYEILTV